MKKATFYYSLATALTVLSMAGCAKENEASGHSGNEIILTASFIDDGTRTILPDSGTSVYWEASDEIKVFLDGESGRFTSTNTELSAVATFKGALTSIIAGGEGYFGGNTLMGIYPYRSDAESDGSTVTTVLPYEQIGRAGSFAKGANISFSQSKTNTLAFYNVCGGVRFSLVQEGVKEVVFKALSGEPVAGKVKLAFEEGVPVVKELTEGVDSIVLSAPASGFFEIGKWYYIVTLPGTLSGGFRMRFNKEDKYALLESTDSRTIGRGLFGSLADADRNLDYRDKGNPEPGADVIGFKCNIAKVACVEKFDKDGDGELSYAEAAAVTSIAGLFADYDSVTSFDELMYFTGLSGFDSALSGLTHLKSVRIPAGFTAIEAGAFKGCTALSTVSFAGNSIRTIGDNAFGGCSSLSFFDIPSKVESIGQSAFSGCVSLQTVVIPQGVTSIPTSAFGGCSALKTVSLPEGLTFIGTSAFGSCSSLESIDFPSSLEMIASYSFGFCSSLKSISIPDSVTSISSEAFYYCSSLTSAVLPSGLTEIPYGLFRQCSLLYSVSFPPKVTVIGDYAFEGCTMRDPYSGISRVDLPESVVKIGAMALNRVSNVLIHSSSTVSISTETFLNGAQLYVPDSQVEMYKIRTGWSEYADNIRALSSYAGGEFLMQYVDLGLSVKWACCNIGASKPEQYGLHFAWGDVTGGRRGGYFGSYPDYEVDADENLKPEYDAAHVILGGSWRMPTVKEFVELKQNCTCTWTSDYNGTGVAGTTFTSRKPGYTDKSIFLPASGCTVYKNLSGSGLYGYYWSSTFWGSRFAWYLEFNSSSQSTDRDSQRYYGQSIRPVCE